MELAEQLEIKNHAVLTLFGVDIWITDTIIATWIIMGIMITIAVIVRIRLPKFKEVPTGFQNAIEAIVELFDN